MNSLAVFVLAGGKSSRMGADKAFLSLGGRTMLERALELAGKVAGVGTAAHRYAVEQSSRKSHIAIVGDPEKFAAFGAVIADVYPGQGPLAGIHAALLSSQAELNLIFAVDLPFLDARFLEYLIRRAGQSGAAVTVPVIEGRYQPLCAVYRKEFAAVAEKALSLHQNKIDALFSDVPICTVVEGELTRAGFNPRFFRNINAPEDWELAKHEFELGTQHL